MVKDLVIDASVFLSSLVTHEKYHQESRKFFGMIKKNKIKVHIPILTVFEILSSHFRLINDENITDLIYKELIEWNLTRDLNIINLEANFLVHFTAHHYLFKLKTSDTVVALTAHYLGYPLVTWDKQMIKESRDKFEVMTPAEFA